ncbi:MAG: transglutaminase-like domain-containing protein [Coriobacteriales bacterium]|jgi:transglutaminase-like putative cysteine protease|nr:transglutaminase-like domain-containing protein [Coriobacteriales bacterium]
MLNSTDMLLRRRRIATTLTAAFALLALLALLAVAGCGGVASGTQMGTSNPGQERDATPVILQPAQPGAAVVDNEKATLDYSNTADGYISVLSKLGVKVKVLVDVNDSQYQYTINNAGSYIVIPLSCGDGTYTVGVWEHVTGETYASIFSQDLSVSIADEYKPFLYPNQYVNYAAGDASTAISQQYATGATSDVEALNGIYKYVVENITYDYNKAATVQPGYLPNNTNTINAKTGICFDYAVLTASLLREQQIPAKLVIGYSDTAYHAWITVFCKETGEVIGNYRFDGSSWQRMDPTFDAASKGTQDLSGVIGSGTSYQPMFYY